MGESSQTKTPPRAAEQRDLPRRLVDPTNDAHDLAQRARSYLYVNCSHCHQAAVELLARWITQLQDAPIDRAPDSPREFFEEESSAAIERLFASTNGAMLLQRLIQTEKLSEPARRDAMRAGAHHPEESIRDLFEAFIPPDERIQRPDHAVEPRQILAVKGDPQRGKQLFFDTEAVQCQACHRGAGEGGTLGPDLSTIGRGGICWAMHPATARSCWQCQQEAAGEGGDLEKERVHTRE